MRGLNATIYLHVWCFSQVLPDCDDGEIAVGALALQGQVEGGKGRVQSIARCACASCCAACPLTGRVQAAPVVGHGASHLAEGQVHVGCNRLSPCGGGSPILLAHHCRICCCAACPCNNARPCYRSRGFPRRMDCTGSGSARGTSLSCNSEAATVAGRGWAGDQAQHSRALNKLQRLQTTCAQPPPPANSQPPTRGRSSSAAQSRMGRECRIYIARYRNATSDVKFRPEPTATTQAGRWFSLQLITGVSGNQSGQ